MKEEIKDSKKVTISTGTQSVRDELVPLFQLSVLLAIRRAPECRATARQITDAATEMFKKRLDTAQAHIALTRLTERGLTQKVPHTDPREYSLTERGETVADDTIETMQRVIGIADGNPADTRTSREGTKASEDKGRHKPFPSRALRKRE